MNDYWATAAAIAGVLGFVLSVTHWVFELLKNRVCLKLVDPTYSCSLGDDGQIGVTIEGVLVSRSASPLSIASIAIDDGAKKEYPALKHKVLIMGRRKIINNVLVSISNIYSTQLPITLQAHESVSIIQKIYLGHKFPSALRLPVADNPAALLPKSSHLLKPSDLVEWTSELVLYTSKHPLRISLTMKFRHISTYIHRAAIGLNDPENHVH